MVSYKFAFWLTLMERGHYVIWNTCSFPVVTVKMSAIVKVYFVDFQFNNKERWALCSCDETAFIWHQSYVPHCHVYQTTSSTKVCSCTKCHQNKRHIHICEPVFLAVNCSLEVCSEIEEGEVYFKTMGMIQEDFVTHPFTTAFNAQYVFA